MRANNVPATLGKDSDGDFPEGPLGVLAEVVGSKEILMAANASSSKLAADFTSLRVALGKESEYFLKLLCTDLEFQRLAGTLRLLL